MSVPLGLCLAAGCPPDDASNRLAAHRLNDTALGDDGPNEPCWSDVECWIIDVDAVGSGLAAEAVGDFLAGALFDGNLVAAGDGEVESGRWRGDVEGNFMGGGEDGNGIGADFVRRVAVGGDAVGADNDGLHFA